VNERSPQSAHPGCKKGAQVVIEERWTNGRIERVPSLAAELAVRTPAIIVAVSPAAGLAAA